MPGPVHAGPGPYDYHRAPCWCRGDKALQVGGVEYADVVYCIQEKMFLLVLHYIMSFTVHFVVKMGA